MARASCAHGVHTHCMHCICYAAAMLCSHADLGLVPALALTLPSSSPSHTLNPTASLSLPTTTPATLTLATPGCGGGRAAHRQALYLRSRVGHVRVVRRALGVPVALVRRLDVVAVPEEHALGLIAHRAPPVAAARRKRGSGAALAQNRAHTCADACCSRGGPEACLAIMMCGCGWRGGNTRFVSAPLGHDRALW